MAQDNQTSASAKKISTYITMIVAIVMMLAIIAFLLAVYLTYTGSTATGSKQAGDYSAAGILAVIGLIALTMSSFTLFQSRKQAAEMKIEIPKVMTTIECEKCGTKIVREYQRGDYVYKELDACQKCPDQKQIITAIYKEVKEKEKKYPV
jgi:Zn finger protein HypA/HybF involved in hydrogenase expression